MFFHILGFVFSGTNVGTEVYQDNSGALQFCCNCLGGVITMQFPGGIGRSYHHAIPGGNWAELSPCNSRGELHGMMTPGPATGHHSNKTETQNPLKASFQMILSFFFVGDPLGISIGGFGWLVNWVRSLIYREIVIIEED